MATVLKRGLLILMLLGSGSSFAEIPDFGGVWLDDRSSENKNYLMIHQKDNKVVLSYTGATQGYASIGIYGVINSVYQGEVQLDGMGQYYLNVERTSRDGIQYYLLFSLISETEADMNIGCWNCPGDFDIPIRIKRIFR